LNFTFTINRNGAVMAFTAVLILFAFYKALNYIEFILFVATAIAVGFALSELAWHLPDEDTKNQPRTPRNWGPIAKTGVKVLVASILIIAGLFVIFIVLGIVVIIISLILASSTSTMAGLFFAIMVFCVCASSGIFSILYGGRMLLRLFKDEEAVE